mgnify:CR=1 FL=1|tara:strand:- start:10011 stop:11666 length:1656 start_codon:yes stop_codon:yes gene_type:complete
MNIISRISETRLRSILFIFFLFSFSFLYSQSEYGFIEGENFQNSVVYKNVNGSNQVMDIFYPDADKLKDKNPFVVFVHGGGWAGGSIDDIYKTAFLGSLKKLVDNGVIVASIGYRLAKSPVTSYESAVDCKDAARFLIKNAAEYKLDESNYGIWGGSAGGHLALVTALVPDSHFPGDASLSDVSPNYKGVLSYYPLTSLINSDLTPNSIFEDGSLFRRLLGGTLEEKPALALSLSPAEFLDASSLPVLLVHGENDTTLPVLNSTYMKEVATTKKADLELITVANAGHSFSGSSISPSLEIIAIKSANFFLSKFGYPVLEEEEEDLTPAFEPVANKIYTTYNPRWDNRLAANGGDDLSVLAETESGASVQWKFTPVSGEEGYYYMDCIGGKDKPRVTADDGEFSIMAANTVTDDSAKWRFDYYGNDILFHITNKNERRLRSWADKVDVLGSNKNGTYMRYSFSEVTSLSTENNVLEENISIYPVPTSDILNITFKESITGNATISDATGKVIILKKIKGEDNQLDISSLSSGLYVVKIQSGNAVYTQNIIKK